MKGKVRKQSPRPRSTSIRATEQKRYLEELAKRLPPTRQEMTERLRRRPKKRWIPPSQAHMGLSYLLSMDINSNQNDKNRHYYNIEPFG